MLKFIVKICFIKKTVTCVANRDSRRVHTLHRGAQPSAPWTTLLYSILEFRSGLRCEFCSSQGKEVGLGLDLDAGTHTHTHTHTLTNKHAGSLAVI